MLLTDEASSQELWGKKETCKKSYARRLSVCILWLKEFLAWFSNSHCEFWKVGVVSTLVTGVYLTLGTDFHTKQELGKYLWSKKKIFFFHFCGHCY